MPITWNGDANLKADAVKRMVEHRAADEINQGFYQAVNPDNSEQYRGCAIGCLLPNKWEKVSDAGHYRLAPFSRRNDPSKWIAVELDENGDFIDWHKEVENYFGIDRDFALLIDNAFESLDFNRAAQFAVAVVEAIPVGVDLSGLADEIQVKEERYYDTYPEDEFDLADEILSRLAEFGDKN